MSQWVCRFSFCLINLQIWCRQIWGTGKAVGSGLPWQTNVEALSSPNAAKETITNPCPGQETVIGVQMSTLKAEVRCSMSLLVVSHRRENTGLEPSISTERNMVPSLLPLVENTSDTGTSASPIGTPSETCKIYIFLNCTLQISRIYPRECKSGLSVWKPAIELYHVAMATEKKSCDCVSQCKRSL